MEREIIAQYDGRKGEFKVEDNPAPKTFTDWESFSNYCEEHLREYNIKILFWNTGREEAERIAKQKNELVAKLNKQ